MTWFLMALFTAVALVVIALAIPLAQRRVKPNGWYGLRTEATFASERVWYEANARNGRDFIVLGSLQLGAALLLPLAGVPEEPYAYINLALEIVGCLVVAAIGWRRANRLLAAEQ